MIVFDTNIIIYALQHNEKVLEILKNYQNIPFVSSITIMELFSGAKNEDEIKMIESFLSSFTIIPVTDQIAKKAGNILRLLQQANKKTKQKEDIVIAATALTFNASVLTANKKDFINIPDLVLEEFSL